MRKDGSLTREEEELSVTQKQDGAAGEGAVWKGVGTGWTTASSRERRGCREKQRGPTASSLLTAGQKYRS